jgi:hypothetical protein
MHLVEVDDARVGACGQLGAIRTDREVRGVEAALISDLGQAALRMTDVPHIDLCLISDGIEAVPGSPEAYSRT